jgi:hypothetical protein
MGRVYQAQQLSLDKPVAIKVLHDHLAGDPALQKRFEREARSASALTHPNIVQVIDFGGDDSGLFIAMELLSGRDLYQVLKSEWPFSPERIAHIVGQVLSALEEAHAKGIVHRDLKPENVILVDVRGEPDFVKVCDFGIAKAVHERESDGSAITQAGMVCGTPEYMSPEQARGESLDGRSDLYAVACMLYQLACGELPFRAETALGLVTLHLHAHPVPPSERRPGLDLPQALEDVILCGLQKGREKRFANASQMREALYAAVGIKRPVSGRVPRDKSGATEETLALAPTGVQTPASREASTDHQTADWVPAVAAVATPDGMKAAPPGRSVHGELEAAPAGPRRSGVLLGIATAGALVTVALIGVQQMRRQPPAPVSVAATPGPQAAPAPVTVAAPPRPQAASALPAPPPAPAPAPVVQEAPLAPPKKESRKKEKIAAHEPAAQVSPPAAVPTPASPPVEKRGFNALFAEAEALFKGGSVEAALQKYLEADRLNGSDARTQRQLGRCYNRLGQRDLAQPYLKRYLELSPDASDAAFIRAMLDGQ